MNLGQLALAAERLSQERPPITVDAWQCLHTRDKAVDCDICVQSCPTAAISLDGGVHVDGDACIRCGLCLQRCPAGVFDGRDGVYKLLHCASQVVEHETVELVCSAHPEAAKGAPDVAAVIVANSCLSTYGPSAYVGLLALGVHEVRARLDACASCPFGALEPAIVQEVETTQALLTPLGRGDAVRVAPPVETPKVRPVYTIKNPPVSRRGFFQTLTRQRVAGVDDIQPPNAPQTEGERSAPRERRRLVNALRFVAPDGCDATVPMAGFTRLTVTDSCNACGMCARTCPTGALAVDVTDDHFEIVFSAAQCTDCGICTRFCDPGALQRCGAPTYDDVLAPEWWLLHEGTLSHCIKCGSPFAAEAGETLCTVCRERRKNPFGMTMPEEVRQRIAAAREARGQALTK